MFRLPNLRIKRHPWSPITIGTAIAIVALLWATWPLRFSVSDGIAQFMPIAVFGSRAILAGELPLFNFYQFFGHPVLEVGYYPLLYPLTLLSYLLSEYLIGDPQHTWNVLCSAQLILNTSLIYIAMRKAFRVSAPLASIGALSGGFCGMALYQGGEWFYSIVAAGFVPLLWTMIHRTVLLPGWRNPLGLALCTAIFIFGSNIQYIFYAFHFLTLGALAWFPFQRTKWKSACGRLLLAGLVCGLFSFPYLIGIVQHSAESIRTAGPVEIAKYFWLQNRWPAALTGAALPLSGYEPDDLARPMLTYYFGLVPVLGVFLSPLAVFFSFKSKSFSQIRILAFLSVGTIFSLLMSLGDQGGIGYIFYNFPIYSWFRHSVKWATFFQVNAVFLGVVSLQVVGRYFWERNPNRLEKLVSGLAWASTTVLLVYVVSHFDQKERLTGDRLPIVRPSVGFNPNFRHVGLWHPRGEWKYEGQIPKSLLAFNYATLFELPTVSGYEPQCLKANCRAAGDQFFPGFLEDAATFDLMHWTQLGVRFVRMPLHSADATLSILRQRFPRFPIIDRGVDSKLGVKVAEFPSARALVFGPKTQLGTLRLGYNSVTAYITSGESGSDLSFNWLENRNFIVDVDGSRTEWRSDELLRPTVTIPTPGKHIVTLTYYPKAYFFGISASLLSILLTIIVLISTARRGRTTPRN